jgi:hypothetical protein
VSKLAHYMMYISTHYFIIHYLFLITGISNCGGWKDLPYPRVDWSLSFQVPKALSPRLSVTRAFIAKQCDAG